MLCMHACASGPAQLLWTLAPHPESILYSQPLSVLLASLIGSGHHQQSLEFCMLHNCIGCYMPTLRDIHLQALLKSAGSALLAELSTKQQDFGAGGDLQMRQNPGARS